MANEITIDCAFVFEKGVVRITGPELGEINIDVAGSEFVHHIQSIGTSEEAIYMGADIGTPGLAIFKNLDTTNYVSIRRATGEGAFMRIYPGKYAIIPYLAATAPYAIADTAACRLEYLIVEA